MNDDKTPQTKRIAVPKDGSVAVTSETDVTEQEIVEDRESIAQRLHAAYLHLVDQMAEFQAQWDESPTLAFVTSAKEGFNEGGADWLSDQAELFDKKTWEALGGKIKDAAGGAADRLAIYAKERYEGLQKELNKHIEHPDDTLYNWAWWQKAIEGQVSEAVQYQVDRLESVKKGAQDAAQTVLNTMDKAKKIYLHRDAILGLPELIAAGDPKPIQAFVDGPLMNIDPELAKAIKSDPKFALVLEIIADHDSALTYMSYVGLMFEAIPPNFYAYVSGKGGAYLMIEVVLLVVTAILSAGAAVVARIALLIGRLAMNSARVANVAAKIKRARAAIDAFIRVLEDFRDAVDDLHNLGAKLVRARAKGLYLKGGTQTTLKAKRESIKRDKKCRLCGSTTHTTPKQRLGTVVYR